MRARVIAVVVGLLLCVPVTAAWASHDMLLLDSCQGVDHPPFEMDYPPGGASYLLVSILADLPGGSLLTAALYEEGTAGSADPLATQEGEVDEDGKASFALPLQQYGSYDVFVGDHDHDHPFLTSRVEVGTDEPSCSADDLAAASGDAGGDSTPEDDAAGDDADAAGGDTDGDGGAGQDAAAAADTSDTSASTSGGMATWVLGLIIAVLVAALLGGYRMLQRR